MARVSSTVQSGIMRSGVAAIHEAPSRYSASMPDPESARRKRTTSRAPTATATPIFVARSMKSGAFELQMSQTIRSSTTIVSLSAITPTTCRSASRRASLYASCGVLTPTAHGDLGRIVLLHARGAWSDMQKRGDTQQRARKEGKTERS